MTTSGTAHARASGTPVLGAVLGHITDLEAIVGRGVAQVSDALRSSIGFDLVGFAGFAVDAEAQERLATGKVGATDVALLLVNPDLLAGDLLRNTTTSQTFRLYSAPDVRSIRRRMASGCMSRAYTNPAAAHDALTAAERIAESMGYGREYIQRLVIDEGA